MARDGQTFQPDEGTGIPSGALPTPTVAQRQLRELIEPAAVHGRLSADWLRAALRTTRTAGEFFARFEEDPLLELGARAAAHLSQRALLIVPERLGSRALALLAVRTRGWRGLPAVEQLMARCMEDGALQLILEDEREEEYGLQLEAAVRPLYAIAGELFGLPSAYWRLALLRFNRLPFPERQGLFDWVVRGIDPPAEPDRAGPATRLRPGWSLVRARSLLAELLALPEGGVK
jgi:hypothetical protein